MTSPYSAQQLEMIKEMQRQQIQQIQHQMIMGGIMNANSMSSPVMLSGAMMAHNMSMLKPLEIGSPPIVVLESEEDEEDDEEQRTLFVANLDDRVTEELLYEVFLQTGPIERVRIPKDNSGRQRTFGFITFAHRCSPPYAMHLLQGLSLYRKTLTIKFNGKNFPPPMKSPILSMRPSNEKNYDNSALRSGNFSSYNDKRMNMDKTSSSRHQDRQSKHASNQMRPHSNSSPYHQQQQQRRDSPNHYNDKRRYHNNNKNNGNNGNNNRYSDHRGNSGCGGGGGGGSGGGKYRR